MSDRKLAEKLVSAATSGDAEVLKRLLRSKDAKKAINSRPPPLRASPLVAAACCCRDKAGEPLHQVPFDRALTARLRVWQTLPAFKVKRPC